MIRPLVLSLTYVAALSAGFFSLGHLGLVRRLLIASTGALIVVGILWPFVAIETEDDAISAILLAVVAVWTPLILFVQ